MGRDTRQARRQRQRREQQRTRQPGSSRWAIIGGSALIVVVIAVLAVLAFHNGGGSGSTTTASGQTSTTGKTIDGVKCDDSSMANGYYHIHMHLAMYDKGKKIALPPYVGFNINHNCLYWLHTHEPSYDVIHLEAPHKVTPTLGDFFDIWHQPLSPTGFWKYSVSSGERMRIWVNTKPYNGNPRDITLTQHKSITIEIGPPWVQATNFNFAKVGL